MQQKRVRLFPTVFVAAFTPVDLTKHPEIAAYLKGDEKAVFVPPSDSQQIAEMLRSVGVEVEVSSSLF